MLNRWRTRSPLTFCVGVELLDMVVMWIGLNLFALVAVLLGWPLWETESYWFTVSQEVASVGMVLVVLWRTGRLNVLRWQQGCGPWNGLLVGMPLWLLICAGIMVTATAARNRPEGLTLCSSSEIVAFLLTVVLVGIAEEGLFRGILAQTLLERFGTSRQGIAQAVVVSGLLFGGVHLFNLTSSDPYGVLIQCIVAAFFGMLQTAIYFRTGNLWVPALLHTMLDFLALMEGGLYVGASLSETVSSYSVAQLGQCLWYLIPTLWILRGSMHLEVKLYMEPTWAGKRGQQDAAG